MENIIKSFLIGSSYFVTIFPFSYLGLNNLKTNTIKSYEYVPLFLPIYFGIINVISYFIKTNNEQQKMFIIGAISGLILSLIGWKIFNLPNKLFNIKLNQEYKVVFIAMILYSLIFGIIVHNLNKNIIKQN